MGEAKFATSVSCMDGRIRIPLNKWIKENYSADYVDIITETGVDKNISNVVESLKTKVGISINAHKSDIVVVSGHFDCAANLYLMKNTNLKSKMLLKKFYHGT